MKTKYILQQLGQITIALPQRVTEEEYEPEIGELKEEKSMYDKGYEQEKEKEI